MTTNQLNEIPTKVKKFIDEQKRTVNAQLKTVTRRFDHQTRTIEKWLNGADWRKTAHKWQKDLQAAAETLRTEALHRAGLATTEDVAELQRRLNSINKKITN